MMTCRDFIQTVAAAGPLTALGGASLGAQAAAPLAWKQFQAGEHGFYRAPVLLSGAKEALLIDGGFTLADGRAVAEAIKASGKSLTTVYISTAVAHEEH